MDVKPRYSRVSDILDLMTFILSRMQGVTIPEIAERYNVSRRTAERMRDSLLNIFPDFEELDYVQDEYKHWGFSNRLYAKLISFTPEEIANLEQIKDVLSNGKSLETLDKTIEKLKAVTTKHHTSIEDEIEMLLHTEGFAIRQKPNYHIDISVLAVVRDAIQNSKVITGIYHDKQRILQPLGVIYGEKTYLVAREEAKGQDIYNYILHKLKDVKITQQIFDKGGFNLEEHSKKSFGVYQGEIMDVRLLFSPSVAEDILCYNFHPTQKITPQADGSVLVTFQASGPLEIIWHLFKWGKDVKILAPEKLKETYRNYIEEIDLT